MVCMHVHVFMKGTLKCRIRIMKGNLYGQNILISQTLPVLGRLCIHESAIYYFR